MARNTELTQDKINGIADELHSKGIKPSPNNVRAELGAGSFSTIKQMLDVWKDQQKAQENIFVPDTPEFAYHLVDKLHRELYLQNRRLLDAERQQIELSKQEIEHDKIEMLDEINHLESTVSRLNSDIEQKVIELDSANSSVQSLQEKLDNLTHEFNAQKIKLATLTERETQQRIQLQEKDVMLKQAEKIEQSLTQQLEALITKATPSK